MTRPTAITFDVYGTLTRWDETVHDALGDLLRPRNVRPGEFPLVADAFEAESRRLQSLGAFRSYRSILIDSMVPAFAVARAEPDAEDAEKLIARLSAVPPHDDVPRVLAELARSYRLAPISNTDDDLLAGTVRGLGDVFDLVVTAQQAQAYKPNPELFRYALTALGSQASDILHVAQGTFADLTVCSALGIRAVWVNRTGASLQKGLNPIAVIDDLTALPGIVASL